MNISLLLNDTSLQVGGQSIPVVISSHLLEIKELDVSSVPTEGSDKPCSDAISSQTPTSVKLPGSLDALLYIVIVLMFYAFSIVILMVKYIRREREEASLRSYYHEFVSREKFRSAQYKNRQFMKRIFSRHHSRDFDPPAIASFEDETRSNSRCHDISRSKKSDDSPGEATFSRLLLDFEDERKRERGKESFTFLGAKSQFCKNTFLGKRFCNKQLCSKCISESVPTIDWDEEQSNDNCSNRSTHDEEVKKIIEVTLHRSAMEKSPQPAKTQPSFTEAMSEYTSRFNESDNLFYPIVECEGEKESAEANDLHRQGHGGANSSPWASGGACRKPSNAHAEQRERPASVDEHAVVSSCSLEVSELLANMPPLGIPNSPSNDMDTLDGLSNLDSETENQSLLNYSSSIRLHRDHSFNLDSISINSKRTFDINKGDNGGQFLNLGNTEKSDKLSDRSSLLSCSFSFDDGDNKSTRSSLFATKDFHNNSSSIHPDHNEINLKKTDSCKSNGKTHHHNNIFQPRPGENDQDSDDEMVRLLNDITVLADQSGVFRNLKYFLRGFYKPDVEEPSEKNSNLLREFYKPDLELFDEPSENSNLLPKETYFGPGSPKHLKRGERFPKPGTNGVTMPTTMATTLTTHSNHTDRATLRDEEERMLSPEPIHSLGNRWAYTYDDEDEDGVISDTDHSSSFGNYCMGDTSESQVIDLSKPLARRELDAKVKAGFSRALIGLDDSCLLGLDDSCLIGLDDSYSNNNFIEPIKANPLVAGYGSARKETKV